MKTNLDSIYKTDTKAEKDGVWFSINDQTKFLVRRMGSGNPKMQAAMAKVYKPFAYQIEAGTLPPEKQREILTRLFVEACMIDWVGVEIDGEEKEFSKELAIEFFMQLPDLFDDLKRYSEDKKNYLDELGNS